MTKLTRWIHRLNAAAERAFLNAIWGWLRKHTYLTEDEIVEDLLRRLPDTQKDRLREFDRGSLIALHFTWGVAIRNGYRLWWAENPHTSVDSEPNSDGVIDDPLFPDQVSQRIIEQVWKELL